MHLCIPDLLSQYEYLVALGHYVGALHYGAILTIASCEMSRRYEPWVLKYCISFAPLNQDSSSDSLQVLKPENKYSVTKLKGVCWSRSCQ